MGLNVVMSETQNPLRAFLHQTVDAMTDDEVKAEVSRILGRRDKPIVRRRRRKADDNPGIFEVTEAA